MRCFIAIYSRTEELLPLLEELEGIGRGVKPVPPENLHITLKFLGEVDEKYLAGMRNAMEEACGSTPAFSFSIRGVGVLPSRKFIRVVYTPVARGREELVVLQRRMEERLVELGFKKEKRKFTPHLTIARVKSARAKSRVLEFLSSHKNEELGEVRAERVSLVKSTLTPKGPVYTPVEEVELSSSLQH